MNVKVTFVIPGALLLISFLSAALADTTRGEEPPRAAVWVDALRSEPVAMGEMLDDLQKVRVVYVGEYHTILRHHQLQQQILEGLAKRGAQLVLALEQFEFFNQPVLDRFNQREITVDQLIREAHWAKRWPGYTNYLALVTFAGREKIPLLALNARSESIRAIGRGGLEKLSPEQRQEFPGEMITEDPVYEKLLNRVLGVHMAFDPQKLKPVFQAQIARDETMASRLATFLSSSSGQKRTAVVICGRGHCEYGLGTPTRLARRMPGIAQRILLFSESGDLELSEQERKQAREVEVSHEFLSELGRPAGDYFHVIEQRAKE